MLCLVLARFVLFVVSACVVNDRVTCRALVKNNTSSMDIGRATVLRVRCMCVRGCTSTGWRKAYK